MLSLVLAFAILLGVSANSYAAMENKGFVSKDVARIVDEALENPETVSFDDVACAMQQDENAARVILDYFSEVAEPLDIAPSKDSDVMAMEEHAESDEDKGYGGSYEYDIQTGEERYVKDYIEPSDDGEAHQVEPMLIGDSEEESAVTRGWETEIIFPQNDSKTKTIFKLFVRRQSDGKMFAGSAFAITSKYLGTAGHCLYNISNVEDSLKGWAGSILCVPAYRIDNNGNEVHPYGESYQVASRMFAHEYWRHNSDYNYDYGVLELKNPISIGAMGFRQVDNSIMGSNVYFAGYPSDGGNMKRMYSSIGGCTDYLFSVLQESYKGQSGGPVWDTNGYIIGIISQGDNESTHCVKFTSDVFAKFSYYRHLED